MLWFVLRRTFQKVETKDRPPSHVDPNEFDRLKTDRNGSHLLDSKTGSETRDDNERLKYDG